MWLKSCISTTKPLMILRTPNPLSHTPLFNSTIKPYFPKPYFNFRRHSLVATATATDTTTGGPTPPPQQQQHDDDHHRNHPWPEWVAFVDHLNSQGYSSLVSSYDDIKLLKDPCLSFARDRYDIFSSLPKDDIQIIVETGCPKLLRKVVNSAKRLRLYVGSNEQNVCSACSLQGSCDRAFVMLQESDGVARTVDLMRLLMFYALDPSLISGAVRTPAIEQAESSIRRLFSMFIDLSNASPALAGVESPGTTSNKKEKFTNINMDVVLLPQKTGSHPKKSISDNENTLRKAGPGDVEVKQGDWICSECSFMNFKRNIRCLQCKAEPHKQSNAHDVKMKKGDWTCLKCGCMNFASRKECFRCNDRRPARILQPGEWECPKCDFLNFRRNVACFKCGIQRIKEAVTQYEEQYWRRPQ